MQILRYFETVKEAENVGRMFEDRGIATFVSGKYEEWAGGPISGSAEAVLSVIVDRQYNDAMRLLNDPDHEVQIALSPDEISHIRSSLHPESTVRAMLPVLIRLLITVGIITLAIKLFITLYGAV